MKYLIYAHEGEKMSNFSGFFCSLTESRGFHNVCTHFWGSASCAKVFDEHMLHYLALNEIDVLHNAQLSQKASDGSFLDCFQQFYHFYLAASATLLGQS